METPTMATAQPVTAPKPVQLLHHLPARLRSHNNDLDNVVMRLQDILNALEVAPAASPTALPVVDRAAAICENLHAEVDDANYAIDKLHSIVARLESQVGCLQPL